MNYDGKTQRYFNDVVARYENRFINDQLGLNAMIGASQERYYQHNFQATKYDLIDYSLNVINGATGDPVHLDQVLNGLCDLSSDV